MMWPILVMITYDRWTRKQKKCTKQVEFENFLKYRAAKLKAQGK